MKYLRAIFVLALFCGFSSLALADDIDFHMSVLDPPQQLNYTSIDNTDPFAVSFSACPQIIKATACFTGFNDTNTTFTSLSLVFDNSTNPKDPSDFINFLNGQTPTCDTTPALSLFGSSSCSLNEAETQYLLSFSGGSGIAPGQFFFIAETGPTAAAFGTGTGVVGITPEPDSLLLFATGVMMAGLFFFRQGWMKVSNRRI
ncbi:hypothetical protein [Tunturiibacter lichenicola]|uniref:hypothetical protein n=1 Tax=Tunturiibacter lichenicola TaxID=2051959 RepID=UPI003D9B529A